MKVFYLVAYQYHTMRHKEYVTHYHRESAIAMFNHIKSEENTVLCQLLKVEVEDSYQFDSDDNYYPTESDVK